MRQKVMPDGEKVEIFTMNRPVGHRSKWTMLLFDLDINEAFSADASYASAIRSCITRVKNDTERRFGTEVAKGKVTVKRVEDALWGHSRKNIQPEEKEDLSNVEEIPVESVETE